MGPLESVASVAGGVGMAGAGAVGFILMGFVIIVAFLPVIGFLQNRNRHESTGDTFYI